MSGGICSDLGTKGDVACEVNGDLLCDTDADYKVSAIDDPENVVSPFLAESPSSCRYDYPTTFQDEAGQDFYQFGRDNALRNIMSYSRLKCRTELTPGQRGVMYHYIVYEDEAKNVRRHETAYKNPVLDSYENDNFYRSGGLENIIGVSDEKQHHTFHRIAHTGAYSAEQYNDDLVSYDSCDVDWVGFSIASYSPVFIVTSPVPGETEPNTVVDLYKVHVRPLLPDSLELITTFDSISYNFTDVQINLDGGLYALRITNDSVANSHYYLEVHERYNISGTTIAGGTDRPFCPGDRIEVENLQDECVVYWYSDHPVLGPYVHPDGTLDPAMDSYLNSIGTGVNLRVHAKIVCSGGYSSPGIVTHTIWVGPPAKPIVNITGAFSACGFVTGQIHVDTEYEDYLQYIIYNASGTVVFDSIITSHVMDGPIALPAGDYIVKVFAFNSCRGAAFSEDIPIHYKSCGASVGKSVKAYPNPTSGILTVALMDEIPLSDEGLLVKIYDKYGALKAEKHAHERSITFDLSRFQPGVYVVHLYNGQYYETISVVKE